MYPLVSVIIPCFNYGHYLPIAIESVLEQTYPAIEVIVMDDGSTDNTREVANRYQNVICISQDNRGLAATRNNGVERCSGEYIVFLDADDWLYPECLATNLTCLQNQPELAFVSGGFRKIHEKDNLIEESKVEIPSDVYERLLLNNFLSVPGAVMYRRWVFDKFRYDESLNACEDYDLYLKVSRKFPAIYYKEIVAGYRVHASSMSTNIPAMLAAALKVLRRQKAELRSLAELQTYNQGIKFWKTYYANMMYRKLLAGENVMSGNNLQFLIRNSPYFFLKAIVSCFLLRGNFHYKNRKISKAI